MRQPQLHRPPAPLPPSAAQGADDARDFADFIAGQDPLDVAAAGWMVRRQDGLTPEEEAAFQAWLDADPAHGDALAHMDDVWGRMDELPEEGVASLKAALPQGHATTPPPAVTLPASAPARTALPSSPASPGRRVWLIGLSRLMPQAATAAAALGVVGGGWYGWQAWQQRPTFAQGYATARGEQGEVTLPDGSTVWLDTATQVEVRFNDPRRELLLSEGQVLCAVQSRPDQPFDVLAGDTRITVVGTRFSVRRTHSGLARDGSVQVVVEEGRVRVASRAGPFPFMAPAAFVELGPGQSVTADAAGTLGPVGSDTPATAAWREGRINFQGTPLAQALAEFERYGDTGLVIRNPAVGALRVHGSFDLRQVDAFARALPRVLPVRLRTQHGQTEILAASGG